MTQKNIFQNPADFESGLPIPNQPGTARRVLSPAVRELADVLASLAVQQLFNQNLNLREEEEKGEENHG